MHSLLEFNYKKATQALNYLAKKEHDKINKMKAIKLIWLAERYHLRKYGRPIVNDTYLAMKYGPVGSSVKDIAEGSDFLADEERDYSKAYISISGDRYIIESISDVDSKIFSDTDVEALEAAYECYGNLDQYQLADLSHKYPEWKKFEERLKWTTRESMSYLDFFGNPDEPICDSGFDEAPEQVEATKAIFEEDFKIASAWT